MAQMIQGQRHLFVEEHGGHCCGVNHIQSFPMHLSLTLDEKVKHLEGALEEVLDQYEITCDCDYCDDCDDCDTRSRERRKEWNSAAECILTTDQLGHWAEPLAVVGFKQVVEFHNSNSGNTCHVFYKILGL